MLSLKNMQKWRIHLNEEYQLASSIHDDHGEIESVNKKMQDALFFILTQANRKTYN